MSLAEVTDNTEKDKNKNDFLFLKIKSFSSCPSCNFVVNKKSIII
jgi:hypothetical protein